MATDEEMTIDERYKYLRTMQKRYQKADRRSQNALLDEMEAVTELHRKRLIRLLAGKLERRPRRKQRGRSYGSEVDDALRVISERNVPFLLAAGTILTPATGCFGAQERPRHRAQPARKMVAGCVDRTVEKERLPDLKTTRRRHDRRSKACLDHLLIWSDGHLRRVLNQFVDHYSLLPSHATGKHSLNCISKVENQKRPTF